MGLYIHTHIVICMYIYICVKYVSKVRAKGAGSDGGFCVS